MSTRWQAGWSVIEPSLPTLGLVALAEALRTGSPELMRGDTVRGPLPDLIIPEEAPCGACAIAFALWKGHGCATVRQVQIAWTKLVDRHRQGDDAELVGDFLEWFDRPSWNADVYADLLVEVEKTIQSRARWHARRVTACQD